MIHQWGCFILRRQPNPGSTAGVRLCLMMENENWVVVTMQHQSLILVDWVCWICVLVLCCQTALRSQMPKTCKVWKWQECTIHILPLLLNYIISDKETVVFQDANDRRSVRSYISDSKWDPFGLTVNLIPTNFKK